MNSSVEKNEMMSYQVAIVGAGSAGIAVAASLLARSPYLNLVLIDPATTHYYQPGWTMVGGGIFDAASTARPMQELIPVGAKWIQQAVRHIHPEQQHLVLQDGTMVAYQVLIVCSGLTLDWDAIEGLPETLGKHGVTSNYRYDLAPYTWQLLQNLKHGKAIFTQPPMPIKCAGAPQKALYLAADYWLKAGVLTNISLAFHNAGAVLFGVKDYVPELMCYMQKYQVQLSFESQLIRVDGATKRAWFRCQNGNQSIEIETHFDLLHVVPPQHAPNFIRDSPLADENGWLDVEPTTLQHRRYANIFGVGDVLNTTNAKTMAAARKQAPIVAMNVLLFLHGRQDFYQYDGYGSCPLTVERGKVVLAEFGYGGKLLPTFPAWMLDGRKASGLAWMLKAQCLPAIYWQGMLKGREWLVKPKQKVVMATKTAC
ncbi:NAD(P)/FAD-dependent oxidoreductase [Acinetobacter sp. MD2]|nr:NAD(P)/FAD-dependent oxidoreductase [Acinetobacter sp. MD2]